MKKNKETPWFNKPKNIIKRSFSKDLPVKKAENFSLGGLFKGFLNSNRRGYASLSSRGGEYAVVGDKTERYLTHLGYPFLYYSDSNRTLFINTTNPFSTPSGVRRLTDRNQLKTYILESYPDVSIETLGGSTILRSFIDYISNNPENRTVEKIIFKLKNSERRKEYNEKVLERIRTEEEPLDELRKFEEEGESFLDNFEVGGTNLESREACRGRFLLKYSNSLRERIEDQIKKVVHPKEESGFTPREGMDKDEVDDLYKKIKDKLNTLKKIDYYVLNSNTMEILNDLHSKRFPLYTDISKETLRKVSFKEIDSLLDVSLDLYKTYSGDIPTLDSRINDLKKYIINNDVSEDFKKKISKLTFALRNGFNQIMHTEDLIVKLTDSELRVGIYTQLNNLLSDNDFSDFIGEEHGDTTLLKDKSGKIKDLISKLHKTKLDSINVSRFKAVKDAISGESSGTAQKMRKRVLSDYAGLKNKFHQKIAEYVSEIPVEQTNLEEFLVTAKERSEIINDFLKKYDKENKLFKPENVDEDFEKTLIEELRNILIYIFGDYLSFNILDEESRDGTDSYSGSSYQDDLVSYASLVQNVEDDTLRQRYTDGFLYTGLHQERSGSLLYRAGSTIDIPLGMAGYSSKSTRKAIQGEGMILRVELDNGFIRFSLHSYMTKLLGQDTSEVLRRVKDSEVLMHRATENIMSILTSKESKENVLDNEIREFLMDEGGQVENEVTEFLKNKTNMAVNISVKESSKLDVSPDMVSNKDIIDNTAMEDIDRTKSYSGILERGFDYNSLKFLVENLSIGKKTESDEDREAKRLIIHGMLADCLSAYERYISNTVEKWQEEGYDATPEDIIDRSVMVLDHGVGEYGQFNTYTFYILNHKSQELASNYNPNPFFSRNSVRKDFVIVDTKERGGGLTNMGDQYIELGNIINDMKLANSELKEQSPVVGLQMGGSESVEIHKGSIITDLPTILGFIDKYFMSDSDKIYMRYLYDLKTDSQGESHLDTKYEDEVKKYTLSDFKENLKEDMDDIISLIRGIKDDNLEILKLMDVEGYSFLKDNRVDPSHKISKKLMDVLKGKVEDRVNTILQKSIKNNLLYIKELKEELKLISKGEGSPEKVMGYLEKSGIETSLAESLFKLVDDEVSSWEISENKQKKLFSSFVKVQEDLASKVTQLTTILEKYAGSREQFFDLIRSGRAFNYIDTERTRIEKRMDGE